MKKVEREYNEKHPLPGDLSKTAFLLGKWWAVQGSNLRPPACKAGALTN